MSNSADGRGHPGRRAQGPPRGRGLHAAADEAGQGAQVGGHVSARGEHAQVRLDRSFSWKVDRLMSND